MPQSYIAVILTFDDATTAAKAAQCVDALDHLARATSVEESGQSRSPTTNSQFVRLASHAKPEEAMREVDTGNYQRARAIANASYLQTNSHHIADNQEMQVQMRNHAAYQGQISTVETMSAADRLLLPTSHKGTHYDARKRSRPAQILARCRGSRPGQCVFLLSIRTFCANCIFI